MVKAKLTPFILGAILLLSAGFPQGALALGEASAASAAVSRGWLQEGLEALYNLDYEQARVAFSRFVESSSDDPIGFYALASVNWWELTNEFDEQNPLLEKRFLDSVDKTIHVFQRLKKKGALNAEAYMCHGGAHGLRSRWNALEGQWLRAYINGKRAYKSMDRAVSLNPELYDAYLGIGIFHYYMATLPRVVKVLARWLLASGDRERGLREINLARKKGFFSKTAARLFLVGIYMNTEKDYDKALGLVRGGRDEFPRSSLFHLLELLALENKRDWESLSRQSQDYVRKIKDGAPSYRPHYRHRGEMLQANSLRERLLLKEALGLYDAILAAPPADDRWLTLTYINRGKTHDMLGNRERALADYKAVLKRRNVWQFHDYVRPYLKEPYVSVSSLKEG